MNKILLKFIPDYLAELVGRSKTNCLMFDL